MLIVPVTVTYIALFLWNFFITSENMKTKFDILTVEKAMNGTLNTIRIENSLLNMLCRIWLPIRHFTRDWSVLFERLWILLQVSYLFVYLFFLNFKLSFKSDITKKTIWKLSITLCCFICTINITDQIYFFNILVH